VPIGGNHTVFAPAYGPPFVSDLDGGRRYGTLEDFCNFLKLTCASPWLHHSGGTVCEPVDVPVNKRHLDMVYARGGPARLRDEAQSGDARRDRLTRPPRS
jgi:trimethylamine---corrinoid protein Co-methyltransferase